MRQWGTARFGVSACALTRHSTAYSHPHNSIMTKQTCCITLSRGKKCKTCKTAHERERKALYRQKQYDLIKETRSVAAQKRSIYQNVLCIDCIDKKRKKYCEKCKVSYKKAVDIKYLSNKRKKLCVENQTISENKAINGTGSQFNQSDCHANEGSGVIINGANGGPDSSGVNIVTVGSGSLGFNKNESKYAHSLCKACKNQNSR